MANNVIHTLHKFKYRAFINNSEGVVGHGFKCIADISEYDKHRYKNAIVIVINKETCCACLKPISSKKGQPRYTKAKHFEKMFP